MYFTSRSRLEQSRRRVESPETVGYLRAYENELIRFRMAGKDIVRAVGPSLLERIANDLNLRAAWDFLSQHGGESPGPDGRRYDSYQEPEIWILIRALKKSIFTGTYRHGPVKVTRKQKPSGGFRTITLENIRDRVVSRAVLQMLSPLFNEMFDERVFGISGGRSRLHAVAHLKSTAIREGRFAWVVDDIRDAFDKVPQGFMGDVLHRTNLPANVVNLLNVIIKSPSRKGLRQGNPLSSLLMNLFLDRFLDRRWRNSHVETPLFRWVDDILVLCKSVDEAQARHAALQKLLRDAGLQLKGSAATSIENLNSGDAAKWIGYRFSLYFEEIREMIAPSAWSALVEHLHEAHSEPASSVVAGQSIVGWIEQLGPTFPNEDRSQVLAKIAKIATGLAFDETLTPAELQGVWHESYEQYQGIVRGVEELAKNRKIAKPQSPVLAGGNKPDHVDSQEELPF